MEQLLQPSDIAYFSLLLSEATLAWKATDPRLTEPAGDARQRQNSWDLPVAQMVLTDFITGATTPTTKAWLL